MDPQCREAIGALAEVSLTISRYIFVSSSEGPCRLWVHARNVAHRRLGAIAPHVRAPLTGCHRRSHGQGNAVALPAPCVPSYPPARPYSEASNLLNQFEIGIGILVAKFGPGAIRNRNRNLRQLADSLDPNFTNRNQSVGM